MIFGALVCVRSKELSVFYHPGQYHTTVHTLMIIFPNTFADFKHFRYAYSPLTDESEEGMDEQAINDSFGLSYIIIH